MKRFWQIFKGLLDIRSILKEEKDTKSFSVSGPRIVAVLNNLGPTFIKLGQMLSLRPDIIPGDLADELRKLLDHGVSASYDEVARLFKSEIGKSPQEVFDSFDTAPFAVASLAQVYKAKSGNKILAVKIQKPGIREVIEKDLKIIRRVISILFSYPEVRKFKSTAGIAIAEFSRWIDKELDYRLEAINIEHISRNFSTIEYFKAPRVEHLFSSKKVLTMEFIEGISLNEIFDNVPDLAGQDPVAYKYVKFPKGRLIDDAINIIFKQMFEDGFFHADPHPGNIFIMSDNKIAFIDFGIVGALSPRLRKSIDEMFLGIVERDVSRISKALVDLDEVEGHALMPEIEKKIQELLNNWQSGSVIEMSTVEVFYRLVNVAIESNIDLPYSVIIIGKTLLECDGVLRKLKPDLDIINSFRGIIEKKYGMDIMNIGKGGGVASMGGLVDFVKYLPQNLQTFAKGLIDSGLEFSVRFGPVKAQTKIG